MSRIKIPSFAEQAEEARRLHILHALSAAADYQVVATVLHGFLAAIGLGCSARLLNQSLEWLQAGELIVIGQAEENVVVRLTQAGKDVAEGLEVVAGIARPGP